jgi:lauroyl/myristoyl acyltransferase
VSWWGALRPLRHAAVRGAAWLAPGPALRALDRGARLGARGGLLRVDTDVDPEQPGSPDLHCEIAARWVKTHFVNRLVRAGGGERLRPLVGFRGETSLRAHLGRGRGAVLLTAHTDLMPVQTTYLGDLGVAAVVLTNVPTDHVPRLVEYWHRPEDSTGARALLLLRGRRQLAAGGLVVLALDSWFGAGLEVRVAGRRATFAPGLGRLVRMTGAPVFPLLGRWAAADRIELVVHEPLPASVEPPSDDLEAAVVRQAAAWLDGHLASHPEDLSQAQLRWLRCCPRWTAPE